MNMKKNICSIVILLFFSVTAFAQLTGDLPDIEAVLGEDGRFLNGPVDISEAEILGLIIPQALEEYGTPLRLFSVRGSEAWQDDVVFFYNEYMYLYWFQNRVWQVRFDHRYAGRVAGLEMGHTIDEVTEALGTPHYTGDGSLFYDVRDEGFPVRLRLVFDERRLNDVYIYRSDF